MKRNVFVPTRNALLLSETIAEILARRSGAARFAVVSGPGRHGQIDRCKKRGETVGRHLLFGARDRNCAFTIFRDRECVERWRHRRASFDAETVRAPRSQFGIGRMATPPARRGGSSRSHARRNFVIGSHPRHPRLHRQPHRVLLNRASRARLANPAGGYQEAFATRAVTQIRFERADLQMRNCSRKIFLKICNWIWIYWSTA